VTAVDPLTHRSRSDGCPTQLNMALQQTWHIRTASCPVCRRQLSFILDAFIMHSVQHGRGTDTLNGERNVVDRFWVPENLLSA
jgi:hypothetical protein